MIHPSTVPNSNIKLKLFSKVYHFLYIYRARRGAFLPYSNVQPNL